MLIILHEKEFQHKWPCWQGRIGTWGQSLFLLRRGPSSLLPAPHRGCSPGTGGGRCSWPNFAVWWKDPDRKASALTCFAFTVCLWRGVKVWKPHVLYFKEKPKREIKPFHFENTRKVLLPSLYFHSFSANYLSNLTWNLSQASLYPNRFIIYRKMPESPGLYPPSKFFSDSQDRQNKCDYVKQGLLVLCLVSCLKWAWSWGTTTGTISSVQSFPLAQLYLTSSRWPRPNAAVLQQHKADQTCIFPRTDEVRELSFAEGTQLIRRNIFLFTSRGFQLWPKVPVRGVCGKVLKRFLRQHLTSLCRSIPHPLPHLPLHLWDPTVPSGDGTRAVHQPRRGHCLEEDLSHLWRWVNLQELLAALSKS